jgi:hypothetical protein
VDAHLLGLPLPSTPRAAFDGGDGGPIVTAALESAGDRSDSTAGGSTEESAASTEVSAQAENDDEAEVAKMHRERLQRQQVKTNRRTKTKKSKLKPEPEPELEPENRESEYHGVSWNTSSRLWQSALPFEGQSKFMGQFDERTHTTTQRTKRMVQTCIATRTASFLISRWHVLIVEPGRKRAWLLGSHKKPWTG